MSEENTKTLDESSVTAGAKPAEPQGKLGSDGSSLGGVQDLGGPTPFNSKPTDDSNKYKTIAGGNAQAPTTKPSDASASTQTFSDKGDVKAGHEPEGDVIAATPAEESVIEVDLSADVAALTEGEDLSEEFKEKAKTIFEAAVVSKLNEELERMHEDYAKALDKEIETVKTELSEKVDEYLTYVAKEWLEENKLAVENGLKLEIMENFIKGLKTVFTENYIEVPESKVDLYAESVKELDEKKQNLDEEISKNMELAKSNQELQREISTRDVCEGLTLTQSEKVRSLSEGVDFVSVEDFGEKLQVIKDNYFPTESVVSVVNEETVAVEETTEESESTTSVSQTDPQVTAIAAAMGRFSKK